MEGKNGENENKVPALVFVCECWKWSFICPILYNRTHTSNERASYVYIMCASVWRQYRSDLHDIITWVLVP